MSWSIITCLFFPYYLYETSEKNEEYDKIVIQVCLRKLLMNQIGDSSKDLNR